MKEWSQLTPREHDAALGVIGWALARPNRTLAPVVVTLNMHLWLIEHGMTPGRITHDDGRFDAAWMVVDEDAALKAVGAMAWRKVLS